jgi:hypothetical protein
MHAKGSENVPGAGVGIKGDRRTRWAGSGREFLAGGPNDVAD